MKRKIILCVCLLQIAALTAAAAPPARKGEKPQDPQAKELSGMSIVGNDEAPKSLYIVPWKSSEIGVETGLNMMLNKDAVPVDRDVFKRQLDFYEVSIANRSRR